MSILFPIIDAVGLVAEIVAMTGAYDIAVEKVMSSAPEELGLGELNLPDELIPEVAFLENLAKETDGIEERTDQNALKAEEIEAYDGDDIDTIYRNAEIAEQLDNQTAEDEGLVSGVLAKIEGIYKNFSSNAPQYTLDLVQRLGQKAIESPLVIGLIASITVLAVLTRGRAVRFISRLTNKVFSRVKDLVKRFVTRIKNAMKRLVDKLKKRKDKVKKNKQKTKKAKDKANKKKRDLDAKLNKLSAKFKSLDFKKIIDEIKALGKKFVVGGGVGILALINIYVGTFIETIGTLFNFGTGLITDAFDILLQLSKSLFELLKSGFTLINVLLFIFPALLLAYSTTLYIQYNERRY